MINHRSILIVLSIIVSLAAVLFATINFHLPSTLTGATPATGMGGIRGRISNFLALWPKMPPIRVYAASFHGDSKGGGIYVLEPSLDPQAKIEAGGLFQINNVSPGAYVLIIGPNPDEAVVVREGDNVRIIQVLANQVTDIGIVELTR